VFDGLFGRGSDAPREGQQRFDAQMRDPARPALVGRGQFGRRTRGHRELDLCEGFERPVGRSPEQLHPGQALGQARVGRAQTVFR
jgi:hypothetical protein